MPLLFKLAKRSSLVGSLVGLGFQFFSFLIPVQRVFETKKVIAFFHPVPTYEQHILIVPKKAIKTFIDLLAHHHEYLFDILTSAQQISLKLNLNWEDHILCLNGGPRQEIRQAHFHFFKVVPDYLQQFNQTEIKQPVTADQEFVVLAHPQPNWETHYVIAPLKDLRFSSVYSHEQKKILSQMFGQVVELVKKLNLTKNGYTLFLRENQENQIVIHLTSGRRAS